MKLSAAFIRRELGQFGVIDPGTVVRGQAISALLAS